MNSLITNSSSNIQPHQPNISSTNRPVLIQTLTTNTAQQLHDSINNDSPNNETQNEHHSNRSSQVASSNLEDNNNLNNNESASATSSIKLVDV